MPSRCWANGVTEPPPGNRVPEPLPRKRVTAPRRQVQAAPVRASDPGIPDASAVYIRTLMRAQLRLAITLVVAFLFTLAVCSVAIALVPALHVEMVFGVPWSWALQAYGMYPLVVIFAVIYVRAAGRNERRYRSLERE